MKRKSAKNFEFLNIFVYYIEMDYDKSTCLKWAANKLQNPVTNRSIVKGKVTYMKFLESCKKHDIDLGLEQDFEETSVKETKKEGKKEDKKTDKKEDKKEDKKRVNTCLFTSTPEFLREKQLEFETKGEIGTRVAKHLKIAQESYFNPLNINRKLKLLSFDPYLSYSDLSSIKESRFLSIANCHDGQRKLTIGFLEFLANSFKHLDCVQNDVCVVYAGASGLACGIASIMFPGIRIIMYDPDENTTSYIPETVRRSDTTIYKYNNKIAPDVVNLEKSLTVFTGKAGMFDDDTAAYCKNVYFNKLHRKHLLFVSDIRMGNELDEKDIANDMVQQMRWTGLIEASRYMHKFRIPYIDHEKKTADRDLMLNNYEAVLIKNPRLFSLIAKAPEQTMNNFLYLRGELYIQVYAPQRTVELRLHGSKNKDNKFDVTRYNIGEIEDKMAIFNAIYRGHCYYKYKNLSSAYEIVVENYILDLCKDIRTSSYASNNSIYDLIHTLLVERSPNKQDHMICSLHSASQQLSGVDMDNEGNKRKKMAFNPKVHVPHIVEAAKRVVLQNKDALKHFKYLLT